MTASSDLTANAAVALDPAAVLARAHTENFPVASRLLPRRYREHLLAIYSYARLIDEIGDSSSGDRVAELDWADAEIRRGFAGSATHPVFVAAASTALAVGADLQPFVDLIAANRMDQTVTRYRSYDDLAGYCALSANPVGRLVLAVFGASTPQTIAWSDSVCTGLQLVEHWQDVAEDYRAGRIYLPEEDRARFSVGESLLADSSADPALRRLLAFETNRARDLLVAGIPLVAKLVPAGALAVAGFIGGGLAQIDAIEAARFDVLAAPVKASGTRVAARTARVLVSARARRP
jgi:squalene synthase HpnC